MQSTTDLLAKQSFEHQWRQLSLLSQSLVPQNMQLEQLQLSSMTQCKLLRV